MAATYALPDVETIVPAYRAHDEIRRFARHNLTYWRDIHGALQVARDHRVDFDPIADYWHLSERRFLVAYFVKRFRRVYAPADTLRSLTLRTFLHFDRARQDGRFGEPMLAARHKGGWKALAPDIRKVAEEIPHLEEYDLLSTVWHRLRAASNKEDLISFLIDVSNEDQMSNFERSFFKRLAWFPYLGLGDTKDLETRQLFFGAFYSLFTSTNSYKVGGGMSFAPILQNNPTGVLLDYVDKWASGATPDETRFVVFGKNDKKDRSDYSATVELWGFLNLHEQPFYNSAATAYDSFAEEADKSIIPRVKRIGEKTRAYLAAHPAIIEELAGEFRTAIRGLDSPAEIPMEGIGSSRAADQYPEAVTDQVDLKLWHAMVKGAIAKADSLADRDAAAILFHIMLDAVTHKAHLEGKEPKPPVAKPKGPSQPPPPLLEDDIELPLSLVAAANDALAYLKAGFHVLLAGAPGTGKTTIAQLVGHAWNNDLARVKTKIAVADAPVTTVANSAWAPFHTIGGILPDGEGKFRSQRGIFMDPTWEKQGAWRLRNECIVLDEMNRADLDRCIGELYPLLTYNVASVAPAGIPEASLIFANPKFRIVATVNDSTIDDIVFPISEGLSRRFVRIELNGAIQEDVLGFLDPGTVGPNERFAIASKLIVDLFAASDAAGKLESTELGEHLPFGVGYFGLLRSWVASELPMSKEFSDRDLADQALQVLTTALRSATRHRVFEKVFAELNKGGTAG